MTPSSRDRISVDLRGLKAALFDRARACGVSPSALVREVLKAALNAKPSKNEASARPEDDTVRLSLRMGREQAQSLMKAARQAGLFPGAFIAGVVAGIPVLANGAGRTEHLAALTASSAELSTLSRKLHQLTHLLAQGQVGPALQYRAMLDTLDGDIRRHLSLAAGVLADLRPRRAPSERSMI